MKFVQWLNDQLEWLKGLLTDQETNKASSKKLITYVVIASFARIYVRVAWDKKEIADIPEVWAILIFAILGLSYIGKGISNAIESKKGKTDAEQKPV